MSPTGSHVRFDMPLVISTAKRCGVRGCMHAIGLGVKYPQGLVQTYLFEVKGKKVLFISSGGCTDSRTTNSNHSAQAVIPHHHDDFYPPLSQNISVDVFREKLIQSGFKGSVLEIPLFQSSLI